MLNNLNIGDPVTVSDPSDVYASWNNEFQGTVKQIRQEGGTAIITVETSNGDYIDVGHHDISNH
jgi:hypothetical protein